MHVCVCERACVCVCVSVQAGMWMCVYVLFNALNLEPPYVCVNYEHSADSASHAVLVGSAEDALSARGCRKSLSDRAHAHTHTRTHTHTYGYTCAWLYLF